MPTRLTTPSLSTPDNLFRWGDNRDMPDTASEEHPDKPLHVVAIGASAGGLDALEKLFASLPADSGAAFVVIQHLSPDHKSMMASLLARHTRMPVVVVEENLPIAPNQVFLIPPGSIMHMDNRHLRLTPKSPRTLTLPIDVFFTSMAEQCADRGIAADASAAVAALADMGVVADHAAFNEVCSGGCFGRLDDFADPGDTGLGAAGMVEKEFVPHRHGAQEIARLIVANPVPARLAELFQTLDREFVGL